MLQAAVAWAVVALQLLGPRPLDCLDRRSTWKAIHIEAQPFQTRQTLKLWNDCDDNDDDDYKIVLATPNIEENLPKLDQGSIKDGVANSATIGQNDKSISGWPLWPKSAERKRVHFITFLRPPDMTNQED